MKGRVRGSCGEKDVIVNRRTTVFVTLAQPKGVRACSGGTSTFREFLKPPIRIVPRFRNETSLGAEGPDPGVSVPPGQRSCFIGDDYKELKRVDLGVLNGAVLFRGVPFSVPSV